MYVCMCMYCIIVTYVTPYDTRSALSKKKKNFFAEIIIIKYPMSGMGYVPESLTDRYRVLFLKKKKKKPNWKGWGVQGTKILTGPLPIHRYMHKPDRSHTLKLYFQTLSLSPQFRWTPKFSQTE